MSWGPTTEPGLCICFLAGIGRRHWCAKRSSSQAGGWLTNNLLCKMQRSNPWLPWCISAFKKWASEQKPEETRCHPHPHTTSICLVALAKEARKEWPQKNAQSKYAAMAWKPSKNVGWMCAKCETYTKYGLFPYFPENLFWGIPFHPPEIGLQRQQNTELRSLCAEMAPLPSGKRHFHFIAAYIYSLRSVFFSLVHDERSYFWIQYCLVVDHAFQHANLYYNFSVSL